MKRLSLFAVLLVLCSAPAIAAQQVILQDASEAFSIEVPHSDEASTVIHYQINHFNLESVVIEGREYSTVALDRRALTMERGLPALPTLRESIAIPDDAEMAIRVLDAEYRDFPGIDVAPSKGLITRNMDPAMVKYEFASFYGGDAWYPAELADLDEPYIMRDTRGVVLELNPFRYNPATHTLRVYSSISIEVSAVGPGKVNVLAHKPATRVTEFESIYARHFLNYGAAGMDRYADVSEVGNMLVITYDAFHGAIQPFVDWKNQMGIPTTLVDVSVAGSTGIQIKDYIQDMYDSVGVTFIVLVGDAAQVPYYPYGGAADPCYSLLAGGDTYPDAFVGRLSAENIGHVDIQVEKSVEYERDSQVGADWYHKGTGIASNQGPGDDGEDDDEHMDVIRGKLLGFTYDEVDQIYDPYASAGMVSSALNEGRSIVNYCGHGWIQGWSSSGFNNNHVNALVNDNMLPFITSVACNTGEFQSGTCFGEAWLRASHNGEPSGAVGFYGSTISQSWAPPMCAQDELVDLLVDEEKRSYGALCFLGSCQMMDEYGGTGQNEFRHWTIFGDPSLRVRTDTPSALSVSHDDVIEPDATSFTVLTEADALVALSDDGDFLGSAFADGSGVAVVDIVGSLPEDGVTLTVSGFNRITHIDVVEVGSLLMPTCEVDPSSFTEIMLPDQVFHAQLYISNYGEAGSMLNYSIARVNMDAGFGGPPNWLELDSYSGQVPQGETDVIQLTIDTGGLPDDVYHAQLEIDSNAASMVVVPITLTVTSDPTGVGEVPAILALGQNYPNPFNPKTSISFSLPSAGEVCIEIFSASGQKVHTLVTGDLAAGLHSVVWDGRDGAGQTLGTGVYFYRLQAEDLSLTRKMILLK